MPVEINLIPQLVPALTADGVLTVKELWLSDDVYEDLRFPAQGINLPGAASDPSRSTSNGLLYFSGTADNVIAGVAQAPHAQKYDGTWKPHIHLVFPTSASANSRWKLEWDLANVNGDFTMQIPAAYNSATTYAFSEIITAANPENTKKHAIFSFSSIDLTGYTASVCAPWRLSRLAGSDAVDNHTSPIVLLEFDIHYPIDALGSRSEFVK